MRRANHTTATPRVHPGRPTRLALALLANLLPPPPAAAHFVLRSPASWRDQDALGNPQKVGPCGDEGGAAATGAVTAYSPGETITISLDETIFHPGHYRVALAVNDRSELPAEPVVTPGATPCGSVPIEDPPVFPVLADGALQHTAPFAGTRSIEVTLPSSVTCTRCTLQVLEFMSNHPVPCFYHHCADISIGAGTAKSCTADAECTDDNVCTSDRCDPATKACKNVDAGPSACDDGNACTRDTCSAAEGCVAQPMTLADVTAGFLGTLQVEPCSTERVPRGIEALFRRADTLLARATDAPAKAPRFLGRASRKLRAAARRATMASGRRISSACREALGTALAQARTRLDCLLTAHTSSPQAVRIFSLPIIWAGE
jgi:hypothetical protein